jgi:hypothetical protein
LVKLLAGNVGVSAARASCVSTLDFAEGETCPEADGGTDDQAEGESEAEPPRFL